MTPTSVRMVLVEGEKADGLTVDHDTFSVGSDESTATASEQVVAAILGTRESAAEGGHRLVSTGVTWRDHDEAAALRDALAAHKIDGVMLVSELHAAGALAQAAGRAVGYDRTALMFLERDTATVSVVDTADGSIVRVQSQDLHAQDAISELTAMVAGLEALDAPPQGVFVVGSGISVAAIKLQLESATSLPVIAPEEAELALARGAALASASAPQFEATTVGLAFAKADADGDMTQVAGIGYMSSTPGLAYSEVIEEPELTGLAEPAPEPQAPAERKPFLLVGSAVTSIFVIGVAALVISLAVSIRPTVDERPVPGENLIVPTRPPAAAVTPKAPAPAPPPETIPAPKPVVQEAPQPQAPRTVFVEAPAPAAPAPAPAAPAPAPAAPPPPPAAPPPAPIVAPPIVAPIIPPPVIVLPRPKLPPIFRPPWDPPQRDNDDWDPPKQQWPQWPSRPQPQQPQPQRPPVTQVPIPQVPQVPQVPQYPQYPQVPQAPKQQVPDYDPPSQQWPGSGSGSRSGSGSGSGPGSGSGSGDSVWPWPSFGH
ncbi:hypothetical protein H7K00_15485 [Mycolicibacterium confluentis]|nr:hypothetical protein [Mycolicibacterium confluentis]MCV7320629.1 hypothetical protein [Mycolicibacterium confluentis]